MSKTKVIAKPPMPPADKAAADSSIGFGRRGSGGKSHAVHRAEVGPQGEGGMTKPDSPTLSDAPIPSIEEDKFGRADFAINLAKSIVNAPAENGFVFALNASWGSGKTSTLNMIQQTLRENTDIRGDKKFIIVNFNPWWFSSGDSLVRDFFGQFNSALLNRKNRKKGISEIVEELRHLMDYVYTLSSMLVPVASALPLGQSIATGVTAIKSVTGGTKRMFSSPKNIHQIRQEIDALLKKIGESGWRVLVVMDDLDRIQPNEMREMFRLVKGVADFPNTIYLLPFDREMVIDAIADKSGHPNNGRNNTEKYMEKIIQMSLDLPPVNSILLHDSFSKQARDILEPIQDDQWDDNYWRTLLQEMSRFIQTPRDMKRLLNGVGATYPMVRGKANPMDFVAIQGIRIFTPYIYDAVAKHKRLFVEIPNEGNMEEIFHKTKREVFVKDSTTFCEEVFLQPSKERGIIAERVLARVFPFWNDRFRQPNPLDQVYDGANPPQIDHPMDRGYFPNIRPGGSPREGNLARYPDVFDRYFSLSLPLGDFSNSDMIKIINMASNPSELADKLLELAKEDVPGAEMSRLRIFLKNLHESCDNKDVAQNASGIVRAFLLIGDNPKIMETRATHSISDNYSSRMRHIAQTLLESIPDDASRFKICKDAYEDGRAVMSMQNWINHIFHASLSNHKKGKQDRPVLGQGHCKALEKIAADKLQALAQKGNVWDWPNPFRMLCLLDEKVGDKERRDCVRKAIATPEGFADFAAEWLKTCSPDGWEKLVELNRDKIVSRARKSLKENPQLSDKRQEALRNLIENPRPID